MHHAHRSPPRAVGKTPYDDVSTLDNFSISLGLVSNNQRTTVNFLVNCFDIDVFETAYGREPTLAGAAQKTNPHYIERALAELEAERVLYVGDSNVDLEAVDRLGVDSAFIRRPHRENYTLKHEPTHEVSTLTGLAEPLGHS